MSRDFPSREGLGWVGIRVGLAELQEAVFKSRKYEHVQARAARTMVCG